MGEFSRVGPRERIPLAIEMPDYLADHTFMGRAVFPATEAMQVLAAAARDRFPSLDVLTLADVCFDRFLFLPHDGGKIEAAAELERCENGDVTAVLVTRTRPKRTSMTRAVHHVSFRVPGLAGTSGDASMKPFVVPDDAPDMSIAPSRLYRDLVTFGPAFRNVAEPLHLWPECAVTMVSGGPRDLETLRGPLGSPFALDAAYHAACAWGQRYGGIVAFPVSMDRRSVFLPTRTGEVYTAVVMPVGAGGGSFVFDILIYDLCRRPCEFISGVVMREVSRGRLTPPAWVGV